jgi:hypothetical protein
MATNTYVALDRVTVTNASVLSFTSIPQTYTDLVIVGTGVTNVSGSGNNNWRVYFNSDNTSGLYSNTVLTGNGSSTSSARDANGNFMYLGFAAQASNTRQSITRLNIMNYSNTTTNKNVLARSDDSGEFVSVHVGLWRSTAAVNAVNIYMPGNTLSGTFSLYGISAEGVTPAAKATGGVIYDDELYYYHVFGSSGVFTPSQSLSCDILVVAGGGGGGITQAGGGGAGGLLGFTSQSLSAINYNVVVGAGGVGATSANTTGTTGNDSQFGALTLVKGGGGAGSYAQPVNGTQNALSGGSGGGGGTTSAGPGAGGAASPSGQGNAGGGGNSDGQTYRAGGGGGGATGAGGNFNGSSGGIGGTGGTGSTAYSSWASATGTGVSGGYAGGGAGGANIGGSATHGGGAGASSGGYATAGTPYTGGGGGGGTFHTGSDPRDFGAKGGSGIVIVRYAK